jgi:group I intron endonuclease
MIDFNKKVVNSDKFPLSNPEAIARGNCGIYKIENQINGRVYIGQSVDIRNRLLHHNRTINKGSSKLKLYIAISKYGIDNFTCSILCAINIQDRSKESISKELNIIECMYIEIYDSYKNGYNSTPGGDSGRLGFKHTKDTIEKMKLSSKNRIPKVAIEARKYVFGFDILNKTNYTAESISEMSRKTFVDSRSISYICNNQNGRFISNKRYIFSFTKEELELKINYVLSGKRDTDLFRKRSSAGKMNKGKKYKKSKG